MRDPWFSTVSCTDRNVYLQGRLPLILTHMKPSLY